MQRVLVAALALVDALVAAAAGIAVILAPLTLLWLASFGGHPVWEALWPTTGRIWQLGHFVPLDVRLDDAAVIATGIPAEAAAFRVSLAPAAFAAFTFFFAWRSGRRAEEAGAGLIGLAAGAAATAAVAGIVAATTGNALVTTAAWQAVLFPTLVYALGAACGVVRGGWEADDGPIARLRDLLRRGSGIGEDIARHVVVGATVVVVGLVGAAAIVFAVATALRAGEVIALFERAGVDAAGAIGVALGHLAYLPTALGWVVAWIAGPGFAVGADTAVSPSGTTLGVVPGVPLFGLLPEHGSGWMLLIALVPVALGALAGWLVRRESVDVLPSSAQGEEPYAPRVAIAVGIAVVSGALAALISALTAGSFGPGRMAELGADPSAVALAVGLEVLVGAAILLLAPVRRGEAELFYRESESITAE